MGKKQKAGDEYEGGATGWRTLSFHDPGKCYPRRLRVKIARRDRRKCFPLRYLRRVRRATKLVQTLIRMLEEAKTTITDPEQILKTMKPAP